MGGYYEEQLSAERLRRCYELAPPRVKQYLEAELAHVMARIGASDVVLELGCGYGRAMRSIAERAMLTIGVDTSAASLALAREHLSKSRDYRLLLMDAVRLGFRDGVFDAVVCIQNGLSAFRVNPSDLIGECIRVTRPGGRVLLSSYSERFWEDRLEWFRLQSEAGLLGEIDWTRTDNGVIVCQDGFTATTISADDFLTLASRLGVHPRIAEVDESSLFCEIVV